MENYKKAIHFFFFVNYVLDNCGEIILDKPTDQMAICAVSIANREEMSVRRAEKVVADQVDILVLFIGIGG